MAAVLSGAVDAIIYDRRACLSGRTCEKNRKYGQVHCRRTCIPGEDEIKALAFNGLLALEGKIDIKTYT
jgi:butyrate kinase